MPVSQIQSQKRQKAQQGVEVPPQTAILGM